MSEHPELDSLTSRIKQLPRVRLIKQIRLEDDFIQHLQVDYAPLGLVTVRRLALADTDLLFEFYNHGLSEKSRGLFYPYPLFSTPLRSADELAARIRDWQQEDDWTFLNLYKESAIIGVVLVKRLFSDRPTSGLAIQDAYQGNGLGYLLQSLAVEQARLLKVKEFFIKLYPENVASRHIHEKCGFKAIGMVPFMGQKDGKEVEMSVLEMSLDLTIR